MADEIRGLTYGERMERAKEVVQSAWPWLPPEVVEKIAKIIVQEFEKR